ncbi:PREDICTED: pentatricopeptide repeat-containing protein At3g22470, mitochondrial-like [Camelina sativa]|uniref:Pentatricopeptide repeat-containing protein At3g22470, mitochondrial-like n=1 Tax=Camelina sativa TaxID=90675 RepID=A0ABM0US86_CAMSA|nr:PREDICTED: pentatricopeptide repeat-containing protein At3g22470, mitochondrial-like [Camelina sativa]
MLFRLYHPTNVGGGAKPCRRLISSLSSFFQSNTKRSKLELQVYRQCKTGKLNLEDALLYFDKLLQTKPIPLIDTFNHLSGSMMKLQGSKEVVSMYKRMLRHEEGVIIEPDLCTLNILINVFRHLKQFDSGFCVLNDMIKRGFEPDLVKADSLVLCLCSQGRVIDALQVFHKMSQRGVKVDASLYATLIVKLCEIGETGVSLGLHRRMIASGCKSDVVIYSFVIGSFIRNKSLDEAMAVFEEMTENGVSPDILAFRNHYCTE